jgi:hypothetical protein
MTLQVINGPTIARGQSLSDAVDCGEGQLVRITMPPEWTDAPLTFQFSTDGVFFNDMFGIDGYEVTIPEVVPGSGVIIPADVGRAIVHIKFRSGTRGDPIEQEAERNFAITVMMEELELVDPDVPEARR